MNNNSMWVGAGLGVGAVTVGLYYWANKSYLYAAVIDYTGKKSNEVLKKQKDELFEVHLSPFGQWPSTPMVLEIGVGGGQNFGFYSSNIPQGCDLITVDPCPHMPALVAEKLKEFENISLCRSVICAGEDMGVIESETADVVVSTLVLCTTSDTSAALSEVKRVLKKGGKFLFVEHVADTQWGLINFVLTIFWPVFYVFLDCDIKRRTWTDVENVGFSEVNYTRSRMKLGLITMPLIHDYAKK